MNSKLERVWKNREAGTAILRDRTASFDHYSGTSFSPMRYRYEPLQIGKLDKISDDWIKESFLLFVKGEFGSNSAKTDFVSTPNIVEEQNASEGIFQSYLEACEHDLVYSEYINSISLKHNGEIVPSIQEILCHPAIGNRANRNNVDFQTLATHIHEKVKEENRLLFLLPSFPFKDQNYFRVGSAKAYQFDLGEIALLIRLHALSIAFYQVHPFGADWLITADGVFYADFFGVSSADAKKYFQTLKQTRNRLNLSGTVSIIDLKEIIDHFAENTEGQYEEDRSVIRATIGSFCRSSERNVRRAFEVLKRGMCQNLANRHLVDEVPEDQLWDLCMNINSVTPGIIDKGLIENQSHLASEAAISYATENMLIKRYNVMSKMFPSALRATVHPKKGQIAVPTLGSCFPWNGVSFVGKGEEPIPGNVKVKRFYELSKASPEIVRYNDLETGSPLYYRAS